MIFSRARTTLLALSAALLAALAACNDDPKTGGDPYAPDAPPSVVPAGVEPATWTAHLEADLLPYWRMDEARGSPAGNFPTFRGMDGSLQGSTDRRPRMLGRQTFTYAIGFMMTGDPELLDLSRAGAQWLVDRARDPRGGWHAVLDAEGNPAGDGAKFAQDLSYAVMGPAAYFFVTRAPGAEAAVLETRDLLFDPETFFDEENARIRDGLAATLEGPEVPMEAADGWELVAQLDPVTAFLLLVQPVVTDPARQAQLLSDLETLGTTIRDRFWQDGMFYGTTGNVGSYGTRHTDFGHALKAYWALLQIDKRLPDHPFSRFVADGAPALLERALDPEWGRWANRPTSATAVQYGSDWWSYAEADQLAATLALHDPEWLAVVAGTATRFREDFVDDARPARELIPSITRAGRPGGSWPVTSTAKCNEWKNGFHGAEHALVMYLVSSWASGEPASLHFAFPADRVAALAAAARPYTFLGTVAGWEDLGPIDAAAFPGLEGLHRVRVDFVELR